MEVKSTYQTKSRKAIMAFLRQNKGRVYTISEIAEAMNKEHGIGKSTVFRLINQLASEGNVRLFREENGKASLCSCVENKERCDEHFHLKCSRCGVLFHTDCSHLKEICEHFLDEHGFSIDPRKTIFYGTCKNCRD